MRPLARALALALCGGLLPVSAPAQDAQLAAGRALFEANCEACHGALGDQGASGDIRGMTVAEITRAVAGFEQMPALELGAADISAIAAYLRHLESN